MPTLTAPELAILRTYPQPVIRYLSIAPRTVVFAALVNGSVVTDSVSGGIIEIPFDTVTTGAYTAALDGLTLDIGSAPESSNGGKVRLRKDADSDTLFIAETGPTLISIEDDDNLTVVAERRIWPKLPRLVGTLNSQGYYDDFVSYKDYDEAYTDENLYHRPLANIIGKPSGFLDTGQTYRSVTLSSTTSAALEDGATIASWLWDIGDCTLAPTYALTDATIIIRAPVGFRYVSCTVTDSNSKTATRYFPVFAHNTTTFPPLDGVAFAVTRDSTREWREMDITIWGDALEANETVIPEGALIVYWEDADFNGTTPPDDYRDQFAGWVTKDATLLRLYKDQYQITLAGSGFWLNSFDGTEEKVLHAAAPAKWHEMAHITDDRLIAYLLRYYTTALDVCNLTLSGVTYEWNGAPVHKASIWQQIKTLAMEYAGLVGSDTLGNIWLRKNPNYMIAADRNAIDTIVTLGAGDLTDEDGLLVPQSKVKTVGLVLAEGAKFDGTISTPCRSKAPGGVPDYGLGRDTPPPFVLPSVNAQVALNRLAGFHFAALNNARPDMPVRLIGNFDVVEPVWTEWVAIDWDYSNIRSLDLDTVRWLVKEVSIQHSNERGQPAKQITWTVEQETNGQAGVTVPIEADSPTPDDTPPDDIPPIPSHTPFLPGGTARIFGINSDGYVYRTTNFTASGVPTWDRASLGVVGTPVQFVGDAFSPLFMGTGTEVNGWVATTQRIYRITDILGTTPSATLQFTFRATTAYVEQYSACRSMDGSFGVQNHLACASYYGADSDKGTYVTYTTDGVNWATEVYVSSNYCTNTGYNPLLAPGCYVSSKTAGKVYITVHATTGDEETATSKGKVSLDYGATWADTNGTNGPVISCRMHLASDLHFPYHNNSNELIAYYGYGIEDDQGLARTESNGTTVTEISPGANVGIYGRSRWSVVSCPVNRQYMALACQSPTATSVLYTSTNSGTTWALRDSTSDYTQVAIAGDNQNILYLFGLNGRVGYSTNFGATIIDRRGNIPTDFPTAGDFVGIGGG